MKLRQLSRCTPIGCFAERARYARRASEGDTMKRGFLVLLAAVLAGGWGGRAGRGGQGAGGRGGADDAGGGGAGPGGSGNSTPIDAGPPDVGVSDAGPPPGQNILF